MAVRQPLTVRSGTTESPQTAQSRAEAGKVDLKSIGLYSEHGLDAGGKGYLPRADLEMAFDRVKGIVKCALDQLFMQAGIDVAKPMKIRADRTGALKVVSNHPQKQEIEKLLAENPDLNNPYNAMSGLANLLRMGDLHEEFDRIYAEHPERATAMIQRIQYITKDSVFTVGYGADGLETGFS